MKKIILKIGGMTCSACSNGLEKYLNKQEGIISASVNLVMATAQVEYDEQKVDKNVRKKLEAIFNQSRNKVVRAARQKATMPDANNNISKIVKITKNRQTINPHDVDANYLKLTEAEEKYDN